MHDERQGRCVGCSASAVESNDAQSTIDRATRIHAKLYSASPPNPSVHVFGQRLNPEAPPCGLHILGGIHGCGDEALLQNREVCAVGRNRSQLM
jgi:hypothetical protein